MRQWPIQFVGAEIGRLAGEIVIDRGEQNARIDGCRAWLQPEIEIVGVVEMLRIGLVRNLGIHENIVVDQNAVLVLLGGLAVFL